MQSRETVQGKRVAFTCNAIEGEEARFSWTKDGKIVHSEGRISIMSGDEMSALTIRGVTTADSGLYTCIASNDVSEDRTSATLKVEGLISLSFPN